MSQIELYVWRDDDDDNNVSTKPPTVDRYGKLVGAAGAATTEGMCNEGLKVFGLNPKDFDKTDEKSPGKIVRLTLELQRTEIAKVVINTVFEPFKTRQQAAAEARSKKRPAK